MLLWRICPRTESQRAFTGTDEPGRWNEAGTRLAYASESRALAALEYAAHVGAGDAGQDLVAVGAALPEDVSREDVSAEELPAGWDNPEGRPELRRLGSAWAASGRSAVLSVPSALVPGERNLLLNPAHPEAAALLVQALEPFRLDPRLAGGTGRPETPPPAIADGSERRLDPMLIRVQRIGGLIAVAVVAVVFLAGIGISFAADVPSWILGITLASWALLIGTLTFAAMAWPPLAWARASYRVDAEGLQIRRGVWWREMLRVPRSRVQHTDVSQGPVERTFGLSTLVVHTAGTHHASIQLEGLDLPTAEALRDFLIAGTEDAV
jgi:hypothetical protein